MPPRVRANAPPRMPHSHSVPASPTPTVKGGPKLGAPSQDSSSKSHPRRWEPSGCLMRPRALTSALLPLGSTRWSRHQSVAIDVVTTTFECNCGTLVSLCFGVLLLAGGGRFSVMTLAMVSYLRCSSNGFRTKPIVIMPFVVLSWECTPTPSVGWAQWFGSYDEARREQGSWSMQDSVL